MNLENLKDVIRATQSIHSVITQASKIEVTHLYSGETSINLETKHDDFVVNILVKKSEEKNND